MDYVQFFYCSNCSMHFGVTGVIFGTPHCPKCNYVEAVKEKNHNIEILKIKVQKYEQLLDYIDKTLTDLSSEIKAEMEIKEIKEIGKEDYLKMGKTDGLDTALSFIEEARDNQLRIYSFQFKK